MQVVSAGDRQDQSVKSSITETGKEAGTGLKVMPKSILKKPFVSFKVDVTVMEKPKPPAKRIQSNVLNMPIRIVPKLEPHISKRKYEKPSLNNSTPTLLIKPDTIDVDLAMQNKCDLLKIQLEPMDSRWIEKQGFQIALVKVVSPGHSIIQIHPDYYNYGEDMSFIAGSINQGDCQLTLDTGLPTISINARKSKK